MWAAMAAGAAAAASASFITLVELGGKDWNKNKAVQFVFKTRLRATIFCTVGGVAVAALVEPISGIVFEVCYFPACWIKHYRVKRALQEIAAEPSIKPGQHAEIYTGNEWALIEKGPTLEKVGTRADGTLIYQQPQLITTV